MEVDGKGGRGGEVGQRAWCLRERWLFGGDASKEIVGVRSSLRKR